jgi:signal transduction histidine kinase
VGPNEQQRLAALHEYRVLDAPADDKLEAVVRVAADPALLRQLLQNLIGDAAKCRDPDRDCRIEVHARQQEGEWVVAVTGIGIPAGERRRVFEMCTRVRTDGRTGPGVGLSTCERIVARQGGRIWAGAAPGGGTTVSFTLPDA